MVSQEPSTSRRRPLAGTRERLLEAASAEFAARGFDGARVDRIADGARVNKAMLYYHFEDKSDLYREVLRDMFTSVAARLHEELSAAGTPEERLHRYIRAIARETAARPHYPRIWLREMAEGGQHLDVTIMRSIGAILGVLDALLRDGQAAGAFRVVPPIIVQMSLVAPLLLFAASAPTREKFSGVVGKSALASHEAMVDHLERAATLALVVDAPSSPKSHKSRRRSS